MAILPQHDDLSDDPRWRVLHDHEMQCPCCDQTFGGVFDFAFDHPDSWPHGNRQASGQETLVAGDDRLGTDLCSFGEHRFVKGLLSLDILGSDESFSFGVWCSLARDNFDAYVSAFGTEAEADLEPVFGWMSNLLPYYDNRAFLKSQIQFKGGNARPAVIIGDSSCTITQDQQCGISFDTLLDIYAATGNDIRPHLERMTQ